MIKNTSFKQSLFHAFNGIKAAAVRERNLRVHLITANLICIFAYHYGLERAEWGLLLMTITVVTVTELVNTSIEKAVDTATKEKRADAKHAKDIGAAAVLTAAAGAVLIGFVLFGDPARIAEALRRIFKSPAALASALIVFCFDIWFLFLPVWLKRGRKTARTLQNKSGAGNKRR